MGKVMYMKKGEVHSAPVGGLLASSLAVGSTVKLMENGSPVEYLVVNQGIPSNSTLYDASCNGTWLLRKNVYGKRVWNSTGYNYYKSSSINTYLNKDFLALFDESTQSAILQATIPYASGDTASTVKSGSNGLSAKIFLLSCMELGFTTSTYMQRDGAKLEYFTSGDGDAARALRAVYSGADTVAYWTRSPKISDAKSVWQVDGGGSTDNYYASYSYNFRPALIIDSNTLFDPETLTMKGAA